MNVGERITYFRELRGVTTNRLANDCGLSQSFLRNVELFNKGITVENLKLVCDALKISLVEFFQQVDSPEAVEAELIDFIKSLSPEQQSALLHFLKLF